MLGKTLIWPLDFDPFWVETGAYIRENPNTRKAAAPLSEHCARYSSARRDVVMEAGTTLVRGDEPVPPTKEGA